MRFLPLILLPLLLAGCASKIPTDKPKLATVHKTEVMDLSPEVYAILGHARRFELLNIESESIESPAGNTPVRGKTFHGYPILSRKVLNEKSAGQIVAALRSGIQTYDKGPALCFEPHHAIHAVQDGKTADLLICFTCNTVNVFLNDKESTAAAVSGSPEAIFKRFL